MSDLFTSVDGDHFWHEFILPGAVVLRQYGTPLADQLLQAVDVVSQQIPFHKMRTPGGGEMSVGLSSCGSCGWVSDRKGCRYSPIDPQTGLPWPQMPILLQQFAQDCAAEAGYPGFTPDACLINCYEPGAKMGLHQDKNELDFSAPIVSVSLGVPAMFQFGGLQRSDKPVKIPLQHGDVVVWGGEARLNFHGVLTLRKSWHPQTGDRRYNLTFRKVR